MDFFDCLLQVGLVTAGLVAYLIFFRKSSPIKFKGYYREPGWNYSLRKIAARFAIKRWKSQRKEQIIQETPLSGLKEGWDSVTIRASSPDGATVFLAIRKLCGIQQFAEVVVHVKLNDGSVYKLPQHPDTLVETWEPIANGWCANGLKIQVLESTARLRILFNGLLMKDGGDTQHVRFNFIWASSAREMRYPEDWSDELAAQALALEPWRDDQWPNILDKWGGSSWLQWGAVQGRFVSYDGDGGVACSSYLRARGTRERAHCTQGHRGLRRDVTVTVAATDGTALNLRAVSYRDALTLAFSGSVRFPDYKVQSITNTDLVMTDFCECPDGIPKVYTINVSTKKRDIQVVLRINADGGKLLSGTPYQHQVVYRTVVATINGIHATGLLELGYETTDKSKPSVALTQPRTLRWLSESEAGDVGYCVPFEDRAAACPEYVGGKGASLALLASVQNEQGYKVPPGFCLTTKSLEKHLETFPELVTAIKEIEAANENYDENNFKDKCAKTTALFNATEIASEVKDEILRHLAELRKKANEQNLGPVLRFAVRSSAVGEDSEALSAAGQNETVLGCVSETDVLRGVQRCWGSMFAFTSAHYRRQNGQACLCGAGVVVQALVEPLAAGVMFTRHPDAGDPSRLLITANYGLGESVVSGSVEPDTIIVSRGKNINISKILLGSKTQRVTTTIDGVTMENVSEADRSTPCLSVEQTMALARIGVAQEELWGAGRDIEWAVTKDAIYLLQARPITSLERWTEEELLHELDFPMMADDELSTFANTGEVMPKPLTAISHDLVQQPLSKGLSRLMYGTNPDGSDTNIGLTNYRAALLLYNTIYRAIVKDADLTVRMLEMAVHGHTVADDKIVSTALHRRQPSRLYTVLTTIAAIKHLLTSKSTMNKAKKLVEKFSAKLAVDTSDPLKLLDVITGSKPGIAEGSFYHGSTTTGSTTSQLIAMSVLVEGGSDFTIEQCNEINTLLSSGGVLSAEVPQALAKLSRQLEESGKVDEFRALEPKKAMNWLKSNLPKVYQDVCAFLEDHGHRAVMEFDLSTKPWALVPEEMMQVLQNMHSSQDNVSSQENQVTKSIGEIIAALKTPKKPSTRKVLRWILPLCRRTIRHREGTKAHLILCIHKLRMALYRLARLLVKQWYLPDEDLIFHFRVNELRDYIGTRDPALLKKASQRRQHYPSWCKLKYAEVNTGWVEPLEYKGPLVTADDVRLEATSVCSGEVIARACVIKDLSEIGELRRGDVLITHSTDIGWSPYFPLLAGIVTELGGLISHGAVIAREYGLPCIVGATHATDIFRTGDMVRLSGNIGVLERVKVADKQDGES